jgi:hypothetical protein
MGYQVIPQPRYGEDPGQLYAIFSSGTGMFHWTDCTREEVYEIFREEAIRSANASTDLLFEALDSGTKRPYAQFTLTWEQAVRKNNSHVSHEEDLISDGRGVILYEDTPDD